MANFDPAILAVDDPVRAWNADQVARVRVRVKPV
jgi:hypothetical protein